MLVELWARAVELAKDTVHYLMIKTASLSVESLASASFKNWIHDAMPASVSAQTKCGNQKTSFAFGSRFDVEDRKIGNYLHRTPLTIVLLRNGDNKGRMFDRADLGCEARPRSRWRLILQEASVELKKLRVASRWKARCLHQLLESDGRLVPQPENP